MRGDPKMLANPAGGFLCVRCGEPLNDVTVAAGDPFCKTACANEWHGFEPLSMRYTLSGNEAGYRPPGVARWDDGGRHRRRRAEAKVG